MHQSAARQPVPRPLSVVAALLAVLGLLIMHTVMTPPATATAATASEAGHAEHEHTHSDQPEIRHSHPSVDLEAQPSPSGLSSPEHPCTTCSGCDHESANVCALILVKAGGSYLLLSVGDLAPSPHELASWPAAGDGTSPAVPAPPSLTALSISRT